MDTNTLVYHYIKLVLDWISDIAWPLAILIVVFVFMKQIRALIGRIKDVEGPGFKLNTSFADQEKEVLENSTIKTSKVLELLNGRFSPETMDMAKKKVIEFAGLENINDDDKYDVLLRYTQNLAVYSAFYETYTIIYGSQIRLLKNLREKGDQPAAIMEIHYLLVEEKYPDAFKTYSYNEYLQWMKYRELIIEEENILKLTHIGRDFLVYLALQGHSEDKPF